MAKKITLKNKNGDVLCPHTAIEQVQGLKEALDDKLGKTEKAVNSSFLNTEGRWAGDVNAMPNIGANMGYYPVMPASNTNIPNSNGYQNAILTLGLHESSGAAAQFFFVKSEKSYLYYRGTTTGEWQQIAYKDDVDAKLGKTEKAVSATSADSATKASKLITTNWSGIDVNNRSNSEGVIEYHSMLPNTTANIPTANGYQNAVMSFGLLSNGATAQMFFSKDNPLYYRSSHTGEWKQLRTIDDLVTTSHIADTAITPAKIQTSIALNGTPSMTVEPTTSSPDKTIASVGLVKEVMEDIEIGGRNLILNSDFSQGTKHWEDWNKTASFSVENGVATFTLNPSYPDVLKTSAFQLTSGQQYIVSLDVKSDDSTTLDYCYLMGVGVSNIYLGGIGGITSEWKRITYSFTATTTGSYCFGFGKNSGGSFQFRKVKIEKGNKATDWSPAPEDLITYTDTKIDNLEIGGTNLLRYIKDDGSSYWYGGSGVTCDVTIDGDVIKGQTNGNNNPRIYNSSTKEIVWEPNTDYVLSYYAKGQGDYSALIIIEGNNVNFCPFSDMGVYSSEWKKYVKKFTTPSDITDASTQLLKFYCGHKNTNDTTSWLEIKDIKIERGNKATDWSPAPEDVVNGIKIDTRNLLLDSKEITVDGNATTIATSMVRKDLPISIKAGDVFTFNCEELILNTESTAEQHRVIIYESGVSQVSQPAYISPTSRTATLVADRDCAKPVFLLYARDINMSQGNSITYKGATLVKGNKPMLTWQAAPEDVQTAITNAIDYTNDAIDKIENGQTVAQKANSLYDDDSGTYKNWGEIDTAITRKIGNKFEDYATKSYVQGEISKQVAVPIASETEDGKVKLATPEDVTAVENDISAVNDSAKAVTPYTLKEYIASKNFATSGDISSAVTAAKPTIFYQAAQPAGGKDGDIWIIP